MFNFTDQTILLTGPCGLDAFRETFGALGAKVCDLGDIDPCDEAAVARFVEEIAPDILLCNRMDYRNEPLTACTRDALMARVDDMVTSAFVCARTAGLAMQKRGRGNIIVLTSLHCERPTGGDAPHSIAMGMLKNMVGELSYMLGFDGVRVNHIEIGPMDGFPQGLETPDATFLEGWQYKTTTPDLNWEDVAQAAVFLASPMSRTMNGASMRLDGALSHHYLDYLANWRAHEAGAAEVSL